MGNSVTNGYLGNLHAILVIYHPRRTIAFIPPFSVIIHSAGTGNFQMTVAVKHPFYLITTGTIAYLGKFSFAKNFKGVTVLICKRLSSSIGPTLDYHICVTIVKCILTDGCYTGRNSNAF